MTLTCTLNSATYPLPPMGQGRTGAVCGVIGGSLVVAGGFNLTEGLHKSAEAYSPATGWTPLPPMPHATYAAAACVLNGRLYVAGGVGSDKLQMWDGTEWRVLADLPATRQQAAGVALDAALQLDLAPVLEGEARRGVAAVHKVDGQRDDRRRQPHQQREDRAHHHGRVALHVPLHRRQHLHHLRRIGQLLRRRCRFFERFLLWDSFVKPIL